MLTSFDEAVHIFAQSNSNVILWTAITLLGDFLTLGLVVLALLFIIKDRFSRIALAASFLFAQVMIWSLKLLFARPRPEQSDLLTYSFPSGHTLGATAVYGMIAYLLWRKQYRWQAAAILSIPVAVGFSRIMLLQHWATDVLAGWLLGALIVLAMGTWRERRSRA